MLQRIASELYCLGRRLECVENTARTGLLQESALLDLAEADRGKLLQNLRGLSGASALSGGQYQIPGKRDNDDPGVGEQENDQHGMAELLADEFAYATAISSMLSAASANLRHARAYVSPAVHTLVQSLCRTVQRSAETSSSVGRYLTLLDNVILQCRGIDGTIECSMRHDSNYRFLRAGGLLERATMTANILDTCAGELLACATGPTHQCNDKGVHLSASEPPASPVQQQPLFVLKLAGADRICLSPVNAAQDGPEVFFTLLQDPLLPRSVQFCLDNLAIHFRHLECPGPNTRALVSLHEKVANAESPARAASVQPLLELGREINTGLVQLDHNLTTRYFAKVA